MALFNIKFELGIVNIDVDKKDKLKKKLIENFESSKGSM